MTKKGRTMTVCVLVGMAAAGLGLYAITREWREGTAEGTLLQPDAAGVAGTEVASWAIGCVLVSFAAILALLATKGFARRLVAIGILLGGVGLAAAGVKGCVTDIGVWPGVTVVSALPIIGVAAVAFTNAKDWPAMSARYDRAGVGQTDPSSRDPNAMWDALDRGEDPTKET